MQGRPNPEASAKPAKERTLPIDKDAFAQRLWLAIKRSGLTYKETARRAQEHLPPGMRISDVSVWSYAKGRSLPRRMTHIEALSKVLGLDAQDLLATEEGADRQAAPERPAAAAPPDFTPQIHVEDLGNGRAFLRLQQELPWATALAILRLVKGDPEEVPTDDQQPSGGE